MAQQFQTISILFLFLFLTSFLSSSNAGNITVYWGQNGTEGSLVEACATGNYGIVNIAFLFTFGNRRTPVLNLSGHCDPNSTPGCTIFSEQIKACQNQSVKVMLSVVIHPNSVPSSSRELATYLWNNFLGGQSDSRPLGDAILDGIDFYTEAIVRPCWEFLAIDLSNYNTPERKVFLSTSEPCFGIQACPAPWPPTNTTGLFSYRWIQFYNSPNCSYSGNVDDLINTWKRWTVSNLPTPKFFLGLPASPQAARDGYIPPDVLISKVLPSINTSSNYGGVMLWNRYYDIANNYSSAIKPFV